MRVWLVRHGWDYDGDEVVAAYTTEAHARAHAAALDRVEHQWADVLGPLEVLDGYRPPEVVVDAYTGTETRVGES